MKLENTTRPVISIEADVQAPIEKVWHLWTHPGHITRWNQASDDWHSPHAENDLRPGGKFSIRMEAKDGSAGFDFEGVYDQVEAHKLIAYTMTDDRRVVVNFTSNGDSTHITCEFEAESENPLDLQQMGWQAILNSFKNYSEGFGKLVKLHYQTQINASPEKVYTTMLGKDTYPVWTEIFNPTSRFEGDWSTGSRMHFFGTDEQGDVGGMVSNIQENRPGQYVSIEHIGIWHKGQEVTTGPDVEAWAGSHENYTFTPEGDGTLLDIHIDIAPGYTEYFDIHWPKALSKLKEICEA